MTTEEIKQLDYLLLKLQNHLGYRYGLHPDYANYLCHISLYDKKGNIVADERGETLEEAINTCVAIQVRAKLTNTKL